MSQPRALRSARDLPRSKALYDQGHYQQAIALCLIVLKAEPNHPVAWNNLGYGLLQRGSIGKALQCYHRAVALWPNYPEAWNNKAAALLDLGRFEEGLECATRAVRLDPSGPIRLYNLASALSSLGRPEEALTCWRHLVKHSPGSELFLRRYRETLQWHQSLKRDLRSEKARLMRHPRDAEAWSARGSALLELNRPRRAILCLDRALEIHPAHTHSWHTRGMTLRRLGRFDEAASNFDRALEFQRQGGEEPWFGSLHQKGLCHAAIGQTEQAVTCHARTLELRPTHPMAWFEKALLEERLGRWSEVEASYRWGLERNSALYPGQVEFARERLAKLEDGSERFECPISRGWV